MIKVNDKVVSFLLLEQIEHEARQQIDNIAELPFVTGLAVMPDCHFGRGAMVGSVIATKSAIIPAAVGVDIGCGMIAVLTSLLAKDLPDDLTKLLHSLERSIPVSAGRYNDSLTITATPRIVSLQESANGTDYSKFSRGGKCS